MKTVKKLLEHRPSILIECLAGDFGGKLECVAEMAVSGLHVYAHNLETVRSLTPFVRDRRAKYDQSLAALKHAKQTNPALLTKSSLMLGFGERPEEIRETMQGKPFFKKLKILKFRVDLRDAGVDCLTIGQYMRPTRGHAPVIEYVHPKIFEEWQRVAEGEFGFKYCASGPLVRSSYRAGEFYLKKILQSKNARSPQ